MAWRSSLLTLVLAASVVSLAQASVRRSEGQAMFDFAARFEQPPQIGQPVTLSLMVLDLAGHPDDSVTVTARVELPASWELVEGLPVRELRTASREVGWAVTVRPTQAGRFELRRFVRIDRPRGGTDEGDYSLPVELEADSTIVGATRRLRLETIRGGQRFRYGDRFLVPIDTPEDFTQGDLCERARVVSRRDARCDACVSSDPGAVTWVVFVDGAGHIKSARLGSEIAPQSAAAVATRAALDEWSFAPGKVKGRGVSDWIVVHVRIVR